MLHVGNIQNAHHFRADFAPQDDDDDDSYIRRLRLGASLNPPEPLTLTKNIL